MRIRFKRTAAVIAVMLAVVSWGASASGSTAQNSPTPTHTTTALAGALHDNAAALASTPVKWAAWAHHVPRVHTSPQYVFIAQPSDYLVPVCFTVGDTYNGVSIWTLVVDYSQGDAAGYVNDYEINTDPYTPPC